MSSAASNIVVLLAPPERILPIWYFLLEIVRTSPLICTIAVSASQSSARRIALLHQQDVSVHESTDP
jgi:hypothetical protein